MTIRLVYPEHVPIQINHLLFSCVECRKSVRRPGLDSRWCSSFCKMRSLSRPKRKVKKIITNKSKWLKKKERRAKRRKEHKALIHKIHPLVGKTDFYSSKEWQQVRYETICKYARKCMVCFRSNIELHVDHIKPISKFPELALDKDNLQVLCRDCNMGKGNRDSIDWRPCKLT